MSGPVVFHEPDPAVVAASEMTAFTRFCESRTGHRFSDHASFHRFSASEYRTFWRLFLEWSGMAFEGAVEPVCAGDEVETATFFPNLRLSYVENLLTYAGGGKDDVRVLTSCVEDGSIARLTRRQLRERVSAAASGLRRLGVRPGDRVVAIARNTAESVVACLAATGLGAAWSSITPDLATEAILNRFRQLDPKLLFAHVRYPYQGIERPVVDRVKEVIAALPTLEHVVLLAEPSTDGLAGVRPARHLLSDLEIGGGEIAWPRLGFNHPLFILFSSGTTGVPKCIVHGVGGTLLEHQKEHRLHEGLGPDDRLYFHTTTGWMMWNWQLSALAAGTEIVLYDGSVSHPDDDAIWKLVSREGVTVFGTSPTYLQYCRDAGIVPSERVDLSRLRLMESTGSILFDTQYDWIKDNVKAIPMHSISGGTDIIGCFVLGSPNLRVWRGESQCLSLALDVRALAPKDSENADTGELICASPFPSRPIGLFGDPTGQRFHEAYFAQNPGVWTHGDFIQITDRGSARILGRSDGVLNVRGVRIGPAEIYHVLQSVPEIAESMAVEQAAPNEPGGSRLVLLVVLKAGQTLDRPLTLRIKKELSQRASSFHVPGVIAQVDALPTTFSNKRSERAARDAINGRPVANASALKNPECLDTIRWHPALRLEG